MHSSDAEYLTSRGHICNQPCCRLDASACSCKAGSATSLEGRAIGRVRGRIRIEHPHASQRGGPPCILTKDANEIIYAEDAQNQEGKHIKIHQNDRKLT